MSIMTFKRIIPISLALVASLPLAAQARPENRILRAIDNGNTIRLRGNRHPLARPEFDRGAVPPDLPMGRMILTLAADSAQQAELDQLVADQQNPVSPRYRQWITPEEYGRRFGVSDRDLDQVSAWLTSHGFQVEEIQAGRRSLLFSGTAGQVAGAFHTPIHYYFVNGQTHRANVSDPEIPEALSQVVLGVASLHDFQSHPALASPENAIPIAPEFTSGSNHYLAPGDFATIYDVNPLYTNNVDGTGVSVAVVARSNINIADVQAFRSTFGLPANNPTVIVNGTDPGNLGGGEQFEATLDAEWAGAVARNAAVKFVVSGSTVTDGITLSAQYIVNHNVAPIMTTSFGLCEAAAGTSETQFWSSLWQQAAAQGITSFVAAGDSGAAGCDSSSANTSIQGPGVNALGSSPYSVTVGGTQFSDTANPSQYWSASNSTAYSSALSYIPEAVWNSSGAVPGGSQLWAGGGGSSIVFPRPSWQTGPGVPSGSFRAVPDVSLAASTHDGYVIDVNGGLYSVGGTSASSPSWASVMALVVQHAGASQGNANPNFYALLRLQAAGGAAVYHDVTSGNNSVPGTTGFAAGPGYDQATGVGTPDAFLLVQHWTDASAPTLNSSLTSPTLSVTPGSTGTDKITTTVAGGFSNAVVLSATGLPTGLTASFSPSTLPSPGSGSSTLTLTAAATLAPGPYNVTVTATGGSIVQNAVLAVTVTAPPSFTLTAAPSTVSVQRSSTVQTSLTVAPTAGFSSAVTFSASGLPTGVTASFAGNTATFTASSTATLGAATVTISGTGGGITKTATVTLTVTAPAPVLTLTATPSTLSVVRTGTAPVSLTVTASGGFSSAVTLSAAGLPPGVTATFAPASIPAPGAGSSTVTFSANATATLGAATVTITASGGGLIKSAPVALTVNAVPGLTLTAAPSVVNVARAGTAPAVVTVTPSGGFNSAVTLSATGLPPGVTASFAPASIAAPGSGTSTVTFSATSTATAGSATVTVTASGGGLTTTATVALTVTAPTPAFTLTGSSSTVSVGRTGTAPVGLTVATSGGFNSAVTFALSGLPAGVTAIFAPTSIAAPGSGTSTLTFSASSTAFLGPATVTIKASGGGLTKTATVALTVTAPAPSYSLAFTKSTVSVASGVTSAPVGLIITPSGGFNSTLYLTLTGLPPGVTIATSQGTGGSAMNIVFTASASTPANSSTITLTATGGGITKTATLTLTVTSH
jgi:pseudomonalisin